MTHEQLIAALTKATGPDRELDAQIKAAVYGGVVLRSPFNGEWCLYREGTTDPRAGKTFERPHSVSHAAWINDRFTASIDAALTLVPEGWGYVIASPGVDESRPDEWCINMARHPDDEGALTFAPTPALAICIAALKARAGGSHG